MVPLTEPQAAALAAMLVAWPDADVDDDDDRRWEDDVVALGLEFDDVSPFLLGRDLALIVTSDHRLHVHEFLSNASPERLAGHGPRSWFLAEDAERALESFRRGNRSAPGLSA